MKIMTTHFQTLGTLSGLFPRFKQELDQPLESASSVVRPDP